MNSVVLLDAAVVTRCRRRVHLEHDPGAADAPRAALDATTQRRIADTAAHRRSVADRLAEHHGADWVEVPPELPAEQRRAATLALLVQGVPFVWGGLLPADPSGGRRGGAELLVRHRGGYLPVIVVRHKVTDPGSGARTSPLTQPVLAAARTDPQRKVRPQSRDQMRLAHTLRLLQAAGLATGGRAVGGVIGLEADVVVWYDLDSPTWSGGHTAMVEYDARFADRLAVARAAATGGQPLAQPSRVTECRSCPWWPTCGPALRASRDVSMVLRGVEDTRALRAAGVCTVDALAALDPVGYPAAPMVGMSFRDAVWLARAWQRDLALVRRHRRIVMRRADVEVDVDMESFDEAGAYLWGCLLSGSDIGMPGGYRAFATWEPVPTPDEARSFAAFWSWLTDVRSRAAERGLSLAAYCYNEQAENRWMLSSVERFAGAPGIPTAAAVREFISSEAWVDLYGVVDAEFLCPRGKGLKTIAPAAAGFSWHDPEAGGENSMRWYFDAVGLGGGEPDLAQRARLLTYNADDVRATHALRLWMSSERVNDVPYAGDL
ncbi:MAG: TM0106 family RecB-like putative nuclease [Pseudonocardiales bacterium]|nr:TM0106 family RecB-like putative nuclease [Pseudonocardiales bacterium]MBV9032386.1 TM0106 family RecB-like putative nuclease [Pseudonocardiales bacterium]